MSETVTQNTLGFAEPKNVFEFVEEFGNDDGFEDSEMDEATELPEPTSLIPGDWAKVEVLAERVRQGKMLWHPDDDNRKREDREGDETNEWMRVVGVFDSDSR